jgi:hypothetical protein
MYHEAGEKDHLLTYQSARAAKSTPLPRKTIHALMTRNAVTDSPNTPNRSWRRRRRHLPLIDLYSYQHGLVLHLTNANMHIQRKPQKSTKTN